MEYDVIVVGAGFAGSTIARCLAEKGKKVLILERRNHIGGNAYDWLDNNGVLRHEYGPHIFHTSNQSAIDFLSRFTEWFNYEHTVLGYIEGKLVPIPFNLNSIEQCFENEKADHLKQVLIDTYGLNTKVPILELRKSEDESIQELADFIYENVFKYYTMKQWDLKVEEIDPEVTGRVPVSVSYDNRYFQDSFQMMPSEGFTKLFEKMLDHENITVEVGKDALDRLSVDTNKKEIFFDGNVYEGYVVYTGLLDELFEYQEGELSYRSLDFEIVEQDGDYQPVTTVNYPTPKEIHPYTRISEYKKMMKDIPTGRTTVAIEYPYAYAKDGDKGNVPYYPVFTDVSKAQYSKYAEMAKDFPKLIPLGRLAEYKYYNMDAIVAQAIEVSKSIE